MPQPICRQCQKSFRRKSNEILCSVECRNARAYENSIRSRNRTTRKRRELEENLKFHTVHDVSALKVGQRIVFGVKTGLIIGVARIGTTLKDAWNKVLKQYPELEGAATRQPSDAILATVRYVVLVEKNGTPVVVWPYLWNVKGLAYEVSEEEAGNKEAQEIQEAWQAEQSKRRFG